jgi:hypothetical protein
LKFHSKLLGDPSIAVLYELAAGGSDIGAE